MDIAFIDQHPFVRQTVVDKIYGCIVGSAIGDTIGLYTEFLPKKSCEQLYPDRKFRLVEPATELYPDTHRIRFEPCAWTDDTDQALLIILGYLHNQTSTTKSDPPQDFASRLQIWISQGLLALGRPPCGIGQLVGGVVCNSKYLSDPVGTATERWVKSSRHVAPNGSLMRTHPLGVIGIGCSEEEVWQLSAGVGRTTHVDPRCVVACCISVGLVRGLLRGEILNEENVDAVIERAYKWVHAQPELMNPGSYTDLTEHEIKRHLERREFERHVFAQTFESLALDNKQQMGYVYKCLGSAVLTLRLAMRSASGLSIAGGPLCKKSLFEDIMVDLCMEGGDADTNMAAAGALLGAYLGTANLPSHWALGLAHRDWLMSKIDRLTIAIGVTPGTLLPEKDEASDGGRALMNHDQLEQRDKAMLMHILQKQKEGKEKAKKEKEKKKGIAGWFAS